MSPDESTVREAFEKAKNLAADMPEPLQAKAFELAVSLFLGQSQPGAPVSTGTALALPVASAMVGDIVDLLKVCNRNPDRYVVLLQELESNEEPATAEALRQLFKKYKLDIPKLANRDLDMLVAKGWVEKEKGTNPIVYTLRARGRSRVAELAAHARGV